MSKKKNIVRQLINSYVSAYDKPAPEASGIVRELTALTNKGVHAEQSICVVVALAGAIERAKEFWGYVLNPASITPPDYSADESRIIMGEEIEKAIAHSALWLVSVLSRPEFNPRDSFDFNEAKELLTSLFGKYSGYSE